MGGTADPGRPRRGAALAAALAVLLALAAWSAWSAWTARASPGPAFRRAWPALVAAMAASLALQAAALVTVLRCRARRVPLRLLFYLLVLAAAAYLTFLQPFWKLYFDIAFCLTAGLIAGLVLLGPALGSLLPRRPLRWADLAVGNLCAAAVLAEVGLRGYASLFPSPLFAQADANVLQRIDRNRLEPGYLHYGFPMNEKGFNDEALAPRPDRAVRVAAIGDSFSIGVVPHYYHYTTVCERALPGVRVDNVGVAATGPSEYAYFLRKEVLPLRPRAVVIVLFVGNDIGEAGKAYAGQPLLRRWFDRGNLLLYLLPRRLGRLARERRFLEGRLVPGRTGRERVDSPERMVELWPWLADPAKEEPYFSADRFLAIETDRALDACGGRPDEAAYRALWGDLETMIRLCGRTPLYVMLVPDEFQVEDPLWTAVLGRTGRPLDRDRPQRRVGAWVAAHRIPALDLLPRCRAVRPGDDGRRHLYHLRDTHFNRRGNEVAGRALADFLRPRLGR